MGFVDGGEQVREVTVLLSYPGEKGRRRVRRAAGGRLTDLPPGRARVQCPQDTGLQSAPCGAGRRDLGSQQLQYLVGVDPLTTGVTHSDIQT